MDWRHGGAGEARFIRQSLCRRYPGQRLGVQEPGRGQPQLERAHGGAPAVGVQAGAAVCLRRRQCIVRLGQGIQARCNECTSEGAEPTFGMWGQGH